MQVNKISNQSQQNKMNFGAKFNLKGDTKKIPQ